MSLEGLDSRLLAVTAPSGLADGRGRKLLLMRKCEMTDHTWHFGASCCDRSRVDALFRCSHVDSGKSVGM